MLHWSDRRDLTQTSYVCGYCSNQVAPHKGYHATDDSNRYVATIALCPMCGQPTFVDPDGRQWPGVAFGAPVDALPVDVGIVYEEARRCMSVSAHSTTVMACRKLLMHVAVEKGADEDKSFKHYVEWLVDNHFVPPGGGGWVDQIRGRGNDANHEIDLIEQHEAEQVMSFVELLLKFVYEFPARAGIPTAAEPG